MDIFLVKNLYNYELAIEPPKNLPNNMITYYVTDNIEIANKVKSLGWDHVCITDKFLNITDKFEKRKSIAYINSFPHEFIKENIEYDLIFVCDSNIFSLWKKYSDFVLNCHTNLDNALFLTNGYYKAHRNTIAVEIKASNQARWRYNYKEIEKNGNDYILHLKSLNIDPNNLGVCSAKYIGWNPKHKNYNILTKELYNEYSKHLQGNVILTYFSGIYKNDTFVYYTNEYDEQGLNSHNYNA